MTAAIKRKTPDVRYDEEEEKRMNEGVLDRKAQAKLGFDESRRMEVIDSKGDSVGAAGEIIPTSASCSMPTVSPIEKGMGDGRVAAELTSRIALLQQETGNMEGKGVGVGFEKNEGDLVEAVNPIVTGTFGSLANSAPASPSTSLSALQKRTAFADTSPSHSMLSTTSTYITSGRLEAEGPLMHDKAEVAMSEVKVEGEISAVEAAVQLGEGTTSDIGSKAGSVEVSMGKVDSKVELVGDVAVDGHTPSAPLPTSNLYPEQPSSTFPAMETAEGSSCSFARESSPDFQILDQPTESSQAAVAEKSSYIKGGGALDNHTIKISAWFDRQFAIEVRDEKIVKCNTGRGFRYRMIVKEPAVQLTGKAKRATAKGAGRPFERSCFELLFASRLDTREEEVVLNKWRKIVVMKNGQPVSTEAAFVYIGKVTADVSALESWKKATIEQCPGATDYGRWIKDKEESGSFFATSGTKFSSATEDGSDPIEAIDPSFQPQHSTTLGLCGLPSTLHLLLSEFERLTAASSVWRKFLDCDFETFAKALIQDKEVADETAGDCILGRALARKLFRIIFAMAVISGQNLKTALQNLGEWARNNGLWAAMQK